MNFCIENIVLWYRAGGLRKITFEDNKVNVITGDSLTGKTAILQIFDYCFLASHSKLPENTVNENVAWYGVRFRINDKTYTIARRSLINGKVSDDFYFSSAGELPEEPSAGHESETIRAILEPEFGIDRNVTVPFGGKTLKAGSKISLRYVLLFTTISEDIITHSSVFFDKQDQTRYAEALTRVFDLAVGIEQLNNLIAKEEKNRLESERRSLQRRSIRMESGRSDFREERDQVVRRAKEYGILDPDISSENADESLKQIMDSRGRFEPTTEVSDRQTEIRSDIALHNRIVRNLRLLSKEYDDYKRLLTTVEDSLKPVEFLRENLGSVVQSSYFDVLLAVLQEDLADIKRDVRRRVPISTSISDLVEQHLKKADVLRDELASLPLEAEAFSNEREKYLFLGELKAKLEFFGRSPDESDDSGIASRLEAIGQALAELDVFDPSEEREMFVKLLEEIVQEYIRAAGPALGTYENYLPVFDYKTKSLQLRKPRTSHVENIGSSSNHMFLHLFLFLALHEAMKIQNSQFVPPLLIIDQPSRPYWGGDGEEKKESLDSADERKIRTAFEVLNLFVERVVESEGQCQVIVFEHVPPTTWSGLEHVVLTERFTDGNALVRISDLPPPME